MILSINVGIHLTTTRFAGEAGMKATKAGITRLAQLARKDIARGCVSTHAQQAVDTLADYSNAALERLRLGIEAGYKTASDIAERVRKRLVTASQPGASDPSTILFLVQSFGAAKLDLGEELSGAVEHLIEEVGAANAGANGPADLFGFVADLVKQVNGDAFALFSCMEESSVGVPDKNRAAMATALLFSGEVTAVEASIGWLLDPASSVRQVTASALEDAARKGKVTPIMLRRMIAMRNWLPEDSRFA